MKAPYVQTVQTMKLLSIVIVTYFLFFTSSLSPSLYPSPPPSLPLTLPLTPSLSPPHSQVCGENHVRTWTVTRFRGRISTQPGSVPISSFKVLSLEGPHSLFYPINSIGICTCITSYEKLHNTYNILLLL